MKILAPVNRPGEVKRIIKAGADELYCGVIPREWMKQYTNVASCNRREWKTANLSNFNALKRVVDIAHTHNTPVYLTLNALYTENQYTLVFKQLEEASKIGVDAFIVADIGLLNSIRQKRPDLDIHISTGGTTFNSETAKFYEDLGSNRINLPRHLTISEASQIIKNNPRIKFDVFILNSGCKNIDGFCTFQHGVNEILHRNIWNIPKKMNFDRHLLNVVRALPSGISEAIPADIFGVDSACLLKYKLAFTYDASGFDKKTLKSILRNLSSGFSLSSAIDTCGACRIPELKEAGSYALKIVGRNYSTGKKVQDVRFLKEVINSAGQKKGDRKKFFNHVRRLFLKIYKLPCKKLCYYPDGM